MLAHLLTSVSVLCYGSYQKTIIFPVDKWNSFWTYFCSFDI